MTTKKITLNELRSIVKQIIKEETNSKSLIGRKYYQGAQSNTGGGGIEGIIRDIIKTSDGYIIIYDETFFGNISSNSRLGLKDEVSVDQMATLLEKGRWSEDTGRVLISKQVY